MQIAVVGTGYVGLVTGTCFADSGNEVTCVDIDVRKVEMLRRAEIPIYEPGLAELVANNVEAGRLQFTTDLVTAVSTADVVFLAVGTPSTEDGSADLTALWTVVDSIAPHLSPAAVVVTKSTVPVGTNGKIFARLTERLGRRCRVASNPEFLKEGAAIEDFTKPDRVVVGVRDESDAEVLQELYKPFLRTEHPYLVMSPESAEMTKYVANALLATKISFINEIANLCQFMAADINDVRRGIGHDRRIGFQFLFPGLGYGGSCFPKDVRALQSMARTNGVEPNILMAIDAVNDRQKTILFDRLLNRFDRQLSGRTVAVWGLAFKPRTDDIREAPALALIDKLLTAGAVVQAYDPEALDNVRRQYGDRIGYGKKQYDVLKGADALVIATEWKEFLNPDFKRMRKLMKSALIFDGRNLYEPANVQAAGFEYHSIGRASALP